MWKLVSELGGTNRSLDSAPTKVQLHFRALLRPKTQQCRCPFPTTVPKKVYPLPQSRGVGERQAGTSYCGCNRSRLGSSHSEKGTFERPGYKALSGGNRDRTAPRMERYRRPQPHVQKLLGPMEIPPFEERHIRAPLGIRRRMIKNCPGNSPSKQSELCVDRTTWWTARRSLGCQQDPG
jgi:hypothetical protein